ncbi:ribosomal protein L11 methyltransferase [Pseudomonas syringae pv. actinidiae ICMP 19095]|nr:ribosomal protein L11 methyltransferase [Pseudomonas syringae pv. actinidiae ICMP 19095]
MATLVKTGGSLALSGILAEQGEDVAAAYAESFDLDPIANRDGWVRITGSRR